jgi:peptidyl-prolyl cis-trans isomerase D
VNDKETSFSDFVKLTRNTRQEPQAVADRIVGQSLLEQKAQHLGFSAGAGSVATTLDAEIFRGNFDPQLYRMFLDQMGMSAQEFENTLRTDALRSQLTQLLRNTSFLSEQELRARVAINLITASVDTATFDPAKYLAKTSTPSEEAITNFYNDRSSEFEVAPAVAYDYVLLTPEEVQKSVPVPAEDVELYYVDNEADFAIPESIKAATIRLNYPKNATDAQKSAVKERATKALTRAKAGESFEALVKEFSDDTSTKTKGGELGWITRGKMPSEFDNAAFALQAPGVAALIETPAGFQIAKVLEYKAAGTTPLDEVRGKITEILQKQEAPVYAATRAQDLFDQWQKSGIALAEFAKQHRLTAASTNGLLTADMDPESKAKGLTAAVLPLAAEPKQIVDVEDKVALVQVTKSREADIAPIADVKAKIIERLKAIEAKELARKDAARVIEEFAKGTYKTISEAASKEQLQKDSFAKVERSAPQGIFSDREIRQLVFKTNAAQEKPSRVFEKNGKFILLQVTAVQTPKSEEVERQLASSKDTENMRAAGSIVDSLVNQLKADATIEINPLALAQGEGA